MVSTEIYVDALFHGKLNIPEAAKRAGISMDEMKSLLVRFIKTNPTEDWEIDITPCWPYC